MRGFPMNLSPGGLDEAAFPYFAHEGKFEFGYGGPPFHTHGDAPFFPGHPIGPLPFNASGEHIFSFRNSTHIQVFKTNFIDKYCLYSLI